MGVVGTLMRPMAKEDTGDFLEGHLEGHPQGIMEGWEDHGRRRRDLDRR